jgi:hypothetical protein
MSNLDQVLSELHTELCNQLLARLRSGEASAQDYNVARQLLKDHKIIDIPMAGKPIMHLSDEMEAQLPTFDEMRITA